MGKCLYLKHEQKAFCRINRFDGHLHFGDYCRSTGVDEQRHQGKKRDV